MDLVGDIGGVLGVFISILELVIGPISDYSFSQSMIQNLFLAHTKDKKIFKSDKSKRKIKDSKKQKFNKLSLNKDFYFIKLDIFSEINLFLLK